MQVGTKINFRLLNIKNKKLYKKNRKKLYKILKLVVDEIKDLTEETKTVELSLVFCDSQTIKKYNKNYLQKDKVTDVLSFPQNEVYDKVYQLGDVLINIELLSTQFHENEINQKLLFLFLHGCLHLIGYDHMDDNDEKIMSEKEDEIFAKIGFYND